MLTWLPGCAYPLWPMWFSVYASCILLCSRLPQSKPLATLRRIRNTRYGWLVKPYEISILGFLPSGTFTLKEATSFACRTNASFSGYHKWRFFCSAKKMTLMVARWKLLLYFCVITYEKLSSLAIDYRFIYTQELKKKSSSLPICNSKISKISKAMHDCTVSNKCKVIVNN